MNTSLLFKNAILNLYKAKIYTVDFAILKAEEMSEKNKINAKDYEELLEYLSKEQEKTMKESVVEKIEVVEENTEEVAEEVAESEEE